MSEPPPPPPDPDPPYEHNEGSCSSDGQCASGLCCLTGADSGYNNECHFTTYKHNGRCMSEPPPSPPPPECADGSDNDGDGLTDWPSDPGCTTYTDTNEYNPPPYPGPTTTSSSSPSVRRNDTVTFSWTESTNASWYYVRYIRDGVRDANWTYIGGSSSRSVDFDTNGLRDSIAAKAAARNSQGWSNTDDNVGYINVTINPLPTPAQVTGLTASTSIPVEPIPPSNYTFTSDETTFSWDAAQNADEYWIQYKQDGVWDASWTYVGDSNTRSVMVRPFQMSRDPTSSIGARVRARRLPGGNVTLDGSVSDEVLMFIVQRPRAATMTDPANNSTALRAVFDGQGFVQNIPDTEILYKWIPEGSRYENQYRINFRRDGGVGQDSNRIDDATGWENGAGFTPFGQLEATYRHSTYLVSANNKIEARIKACNRSGCSDNWSNVIAVNIVLPPPGSRTINTISVGVATTEALDTTQDPQYRQLTNSSATTKYYRLKKTSGTGGSTLSIVDGTDTQITSNVVTQSNAIIFSVDAGQTRYIKFTPTSSGSYNHILYQYSSFPPYEGL
ncbi:MAG: hypothetical protein QF747_03025, partial [Patescibacteria group bacterium]|nr:hypothetical protein [Patescibacteria group bacterium]